MSDDLFILLDIDTQMVLLSFLIWNLIIQIPSFFETSQSPAVTEYKSQLHKLELAKRSRRPSLDSDLSPSGFLLDRSMHKISCENLDDSDSGFLFDRSMRKISCENLDDSDSEESC